MSNIWSKFDKTVDAEGLKKDIEAAAEGNMEFKEVPVGQYEVKITKMEPNTSKKGDPMLTVWFKILNGEYEGSLIFYNQVVTQGFGIHAANEFMRSLDTDVDIKWESPSQYADLILDVFEAVDGNLEFALKYGKNSKGYNTYEITEVFEV